MANILILTFEAWVSSDVLPLKLANPTWVRLDGQMNDDEKIDARRIFGRFRHKDRIWQIHGDTRFAPIERAFDAIQRGQLADPFVVVERNGKPAILNLIESLSQKPKYFYAYEQA